MHVCLVAAALRPAGNRGRESQTTKLWLDLQAAVFVHASAVLPSHRTPEPATMNTALVDMSAVSGRVVQLAVAIRARGVHARLNWPEPIAHRATQQPSTPVLLLALVGAWVRGGIPSTDQACEFFSD